MIQQQTILDVADNSGAKKVFCITLDAAHPAPGYAGKVDVSCHEVRLEGVAGDENIKRYGGKIGETDFASGKLHLDHHGRSYTT